MKKRKIIYPNLVLAIEGGILSLLFYFITAYAWYITIFKFDEGGVPCAVMAIMFSLFSVFWVLQFHNQIFCRILITDKYIVWFGLFLPIVKLTYDEIKYIEIRTFDEGNVMYNKQLKNVDSYKFILLSATPISRKRVDKINTSRKQKLIKFAVSYKLCEALIEHISSPNPINHQLMLYKKAKQ